MKEGGCRPSCLNCEIVNEAMQDLRWVGDIAGGLSVPAILDYLELWDTLENVQLLEN